MTVVPEKWWRDELSGDLELDVSRVPEASMFDSDEHGIGEWKKVDFVFHWPEEKLLWLVEVKDVDNPVARSHPDALIEKFQSEQLIRGSLAGKAKDSFLYLLLQNRLPKDTQIVYYVLFAWDGLAASRKARLFGRVTRSLRGALGIGGPQGRGWVQPGLYIHACMIMPLDDWNTYVGSRVPVRRLSTNHENSR